jgi:Zn-dependent protease with chaperone function/tellurite resistance protein
MPGADLRAAGDRQLAESLLREPIIRKALEKFDRLAEEMGSRRHLLATALRLTPEMAPDVHEIVEGCHRLLGLEAPLEVYVYPESAFNAAAVRPEQERIFVLFSAGLLEAFEPDELRFVAGHELGHHLFEHHKIPSVALLHGIVQTDPALVLQLFAWQRYAEISSDRTGLACAGGLEPAARALFKLASGLSGGRIKVRIDQFLAQVGDFRAESERLTKAHEPVRSDWFATHPFSPLRLRAAEVFSRSELMIPGGIRREQLEAEVEDVVRLMEPGYLQERSEVAEAMRRLLFAGAVLIATSSGGVDEQALAALERLLGPGAIPTEVNADAVRAQLPRWVQRVMEVVPPLRRAQVIRDLVVIARADGSIGELEQRVLHEIASAVGVDPSVIARTETATSCCDP